MPQANVMLQRPQLGPGAVAIKHTCGGTPVGGKPQPPSFKSNVTIHDEARDDAEHDELKAAAGRRLRQPLVRAATTEGLTTAGNCRLWLATA